MLRIVIALSVLICQINGFAQVKLPGIDKSPLDMSYFPANFPVLKAQDKAGEKPFARVIYSRPAMNGRKIFGELVELGKVWRLGANESTEIEFFADAVIGSSKVKKGRYTVFAIPGTSNWTIILNKELNTWGAFNYHSDKDVLRVQVAITKPTETVESLTIYFDGIVNSATCNMIAVWENSMISLPISFSKK